MRQPQEYSPMFIQQKQQRNSRADGSRRAFLIVGATAMLAGGAGWWATSQFFHSQPQPAAVPVDKHQIFNLPLTANPPDLEYAWLPDSTHMACVTQSEIFLVDVKSGQVTWKQQLPASSNTLLIHWSADGTHALIAGKNTPSVHDPIWGGKQIIWPGPYQFFLLSMNTTENGWKVVFSPDETLFAAANPVVNDSVEIWNMQEGRRIAECQPSLGSTGDAGPDFAMAWAPDNASLAIYMDWSGSSPSSPTLTTWRASDGHLLWTSHLDSSGSTQIKWSPDSSTLAYSFTSDTNTTRLTVLDGQTGAIRFQTTLAPVSRAYPQTETSEMFAWSPESTQLALLAVENGSPVIQIWDAKMGRYLFTCQRVQAQPGAIFWSPDGRYLVATEADQLPSESGFPPGAAMIQFWNAQTGKALFAYNAPGFPESLLWSPDSRFLAVHTTNGNCVAQSGFPGPPKCSYTYALQMFQVN